MLLQLITVDMFTSSFIVIISDFHADDIHFVAVGVVSRFSV